jgi:hypothetical protein
MTRLLETNTRRVHYQAPLTVPGVIDRTGVRSLCRRVVGLCALGTPTHKPSFSRTAVVARNGRLETRYAPAYVEVITANFGKYPIDEVRQKGPKIWLPGRCAELRKCPTVSKRAARVKNGGPHPRKLMCFGLRANESYAA